MSLTQQKGRAHSLRPTTGAWQSTMAPNWLPITVKKRQKDGKRFGKGIYTACVEFANWERKLQKESSANLAVSPANTDCYFEGEWLWISPFFAVLCNFTESIDRKRKVHTTCKQTCRFREKANHEIERKEAPLMISDWSSILCHWPRCFFFFFAQTEESINCAFHYWTNLDANA